MLKKILLATVTSAFLLLSVAVHAEPVTMVFTCKLKDGSTKDDAMAINARWLKWARATGGSDEITSSYVTTVIGDLGGFMWVDTYPDIATWGKIAAVSYTHLTLPTTGHECISRWSPYH